MREETFEVVEGTATEGEVEGSGGVVEAMDDGRLEDVGERVRVSDCVLGEPPGDWLCEGVKEPDEEEGVCLCVCQQTGQGT